ncbi:hypothetical protein ACOMHN_058927 [Nucella lapillus]
MIIKISQFHHGKYGQPKNTQKARQKFDGEKWFHPPHPEPGFNIRQERQESETRSGFLGLLHSVVSNSILTLFQRPEENRSRGCGDSSHPSFRHKPLSRKHALSDMAANRCHSAGSIFHRACTVTLWLILLTAGMGAVAGNPCGEEGGSVAAREQKVIVQCPLTADVYQTKQSVMINVFSISSHGAEKVLGCDWRSRLGKFDCLPSLFHAQLIAIHSDSVRASLPKHRLQIGAYRCQLLPYDRDQPFTDCTITEQEEATTESQVTPTTAVHHETDENNSDLSNGPQEKSFACSADDQSGLVAAVVAMTITVFCLLMAMAAMVIYLLLYKLHK